MEGTFYFPLPPDASLSRLAMYVDGDLMEGGMAERQHALAWQLRIALTAVRMEELSGGVTSTTLSQLTTVNESFSEGRDTKDRIHADELLERHSPST